jgi:hypothetical protein
LLPEFESDYAFHCTHHERTAANQRRGGYWHYYSGGPALGLMTRRNDSHEP